MNKKIILTILFTLVLGVAYYGISPIFKNTYLDESVPTQTKLEPSTNEIEKMEVIQVSTSTKSEASLGTPSTNETLSYIKDTPGHPASGTVKVITLEKTRIIRYENFKTINGPDLYVYLSKDLEAKNFINLGKIKATEGNINYEVPKEINIQDYSYVLIWCKAFGVLFNSANISNLTK